MARPEPMNATPLHAKARVSLEFSDSLFVAGGFLTGKMDLECKTDRGLGLGVIKAELFAIQELTSRDHSATNTFLHVTRYFQGPGLPPSNAVESQLSPELVSDGLPDYYLPARKGTTTFFFRFPLPVSSPASIEFNEGLAKLIYEVRASVGVLWKNDRQVVMERKEVRVVEALGPSNWVNEERIALGENGKLCAQGRILNPYLVAGHDACVELFVKNHSTTRTSSLDLSLKHNLITTQQNESLPLSDCFLNLPFRGPEYIAHPGTEGVANLVFPIPPEFQGVRAGPINAGEDEEEREVESLFHVQCVVEIRIGMGLGHADVILELPVTIMHAAAVELCSSPDSNTRSGPPPRTFPNFEYCQYAENRHDGYPSPAYSPPIDNAYPCLRSMPVQVQPLVYEYPHAYSNANIYTFRSLSVGPLISRQLPPAPLQIQKDVPLYPGLPMNGNQNAKCRLDQPEPGKGERASRISAHLHTSSRNRSVSPQAHRFSLADSTPNVFEASLAPNSTALPGLSSNQAHKPTLTLKYIPGSHEFRGEILSPLPVPSRKQPYRSNQDTVKSGNAIDLECVAAEDTVGKEHPTRGGTLSLARIPSEDALDDTLKLPPVPILFPVATRPRPETRDLVGDLGVLEKKLQEQVGIRKLDPSSLADVSSVLPDPITIPGNKPYDPPTDSAISSLSLAADGPLSDSKSSSEKVRENHPPCEHASKAVDSKEVIMYERENAKKEREKRTEAHKLRKAATGRIVTWLCEIDPNTAPSSSDTPVISSSNSPVEDLTFDIDRKTHPQHQSSPNHSHIDSFADDISTRSSGFVLNDATNTYLLAQRPDESDSSRSETPTQPAAPPIASSASGGSPQNNRFLRRLVGRVSPPFTKYDVKSARGGRGGKLTSVAALWASMTHGSSQSNLSSSKANIAEHSVQVEMPRAFEKNKDRLAEHPKASRQDPNYHDSLTSGNAVGVKSSSVPAIISSSLATPVLSSTASLARSLRREYPKNIYPHEQSDGRNVENRYNEESINQFWPKCSPGGELVFGQERLKNLIKKYQQGLRD